MPGGLDRHENRFGRYCYRVDRAAVIDDQDLIVGVAEQRETEAAVPSNGVALRIEIEREEDGVASVGRKAEPVLLVAECRIRLPLTQPVGGSGLAVPLRRSIRPQAWASRSALKYSSYGRSVVVAERCLT